MTHPGSIDITWVPREETPEIPSLPNPKGGRSLDVLSSVWVSGVTCQACQASGPKKALIAHEAEAHPDRLIMAAQCEQCFMQNWLLLEDVRPVHGGSEIIQELKGSDLHTPVPRDDHPFAPPGVILPEDPDFFIGPSDTGEKWPVRDKGTVEGLTCPICGRRDKAQGYTVEEPRADPPRLWLVSQCANCRNYHWSRL